MLILPASRLSVVPQSYNLGNQYLRGNNSFRTINGLTQPFAMGFRMPFDGDITHLVIPIGTAPTITSTARIKIAITRASGNRPGTAAADILASSTVTIGTGTSIDTNVFKTDEWEAPAATHDGSDPTAGVLLLPFSSTTGMLQAGSSLFACGFITSASFSAGTWRSNQFVAGAPVLADAFNRLADWTAWDWLATGTTFSANPAGLVHGGDICPEFLIRVR